MTRRKYTLFGWRTIGILVVLVPLLYAIRGLIGEAWALPLLILFAVPCLMVGVWSGEKLHKYWREI